MSSTLNNSNQSLAWDPEPTNIEARLQFLNDRKLPALFTAIPGESLHQLLIEFRQPLKALQLRHGALLFRGFDLKTPEDFRSIADLWFRSDLKDYVGGVSPRGKVISGVYESTKFPAHIRIPQHNEMAYLPEPPRELAFFCEVEPQHQGETPLADSRLIYQLMPPATRQIFEEAGISYHRYLYGPRRSLRNRNRHRIAKLHTSWMTAFSTNDPAVVEQACAETGSKVTWDQQGGARISNTLPSIRKHPETGETLWLNQVATFLSSPRSTGLLRWLAYQIGFRNPFDRPFHATLSDGTPITLRQLNHVHDAIDAATIKFPWQRGDLLLVDNFLVTHGRSPYKGDRRILVAIH